MSSATTTRSGLYGDDRLDVRVEVVELGRRSARRVVGVLVDRLHLRARADGVEHLGRRRRQRDDRRRPGLHRDLAVGRMDRHGKPDRRCPRGRRPDGRARQLTAALDEQPERRSGPARRPGGSSLRGLAGHCSSSIGCGGRSAPAATPKGVQRTALPPRTGFVAQVRRPGSPPAGALPLRDSAGISPVFAETRRPGIGPEQHERSAPPRGASRAPTKRRSRWPSTTA